MFAKLKLHAPPVTLVVAILAWIFGNKVSGSTLQEIGSLITVAIAGAFAVPAVGAVKSAATSVAAKVSGK